MARTLDRAFAVRHARAVALAINSPGGSAVQSHLIFRRIRELAEEKGVPVIAFVEDVAASGGYMIACAADEIVCDPASIVGSIGVIGASFGFAEAMKKLGVERRIYTAGEHKSMLDPFLPEKEEDVRRLTAIQQDIHEMFIDLVRSRRGARLTGPERRMFSGEYWVAKTAQGIWPRRCRSAICARSCARAFWRGGGDAADHGRSAAVRAARPGRDRRVPGLPRDMRLDRHPASIAESGVG